MTGVRRLFAHRRWFATWLLAATLAVRVLVPGGFMPAQTGSLTLMICSGHMVPASMTMAMPGMDRHDGDTPAGGHDKSDEACPFAGLAMPSLAGADAPAVAMPVTILAARPIAAPPDARAPPRRGFLQPPQTGPPTA